MKNPLTSPYLVWRNRAILLSSSVIFGCSFLSHTALALPWGDLKPEIEKINNHKKPDTKVMAQLIGTVDTTMIYTNALKAKNLQPLFCLPADGKMGLKEVLTTITQQAAAQQASDKTPSGELFIRGMATQYPCAAAIEN